MITARSRPGIYAYSHLLLVLYAAISVSPTIPLFIFTVVLSTNLQSSTVSYPLQSLGSDCVRIVFFLKLSLISWFFFEVGFYKPFYR